MSQTTVDFTQDTEREGMNCQPFQAETARLLKILGGAVYQNTEAFLRELISNASDACDKMKFQVLREGSDHSRIEDLKIEIIPDKIKRTLVIKDNGVGMTRQDLIDNLGTIACSGTAKYMSDNPACDDASTLIGQFGVGFYSSFLVADRVVVISKHDDDEQHRWESRGDGFTVVRDDADVLHTKSGTIVILHIRDDHDRFLESRTLKDVAMKHSGFVGYPLNLYVEKERKVEVDDEEEEESKPEEKPEGEEQEEGQVVEVKEARKKKKKEVKEVYFEFEHINKVRSLWLRNPDSVTQEEYDQLYKALSRDWEGPLAVKHFSVEGAVSYHCILFCPQRPRMELFEKRDRTKTTQLKLYVKGVFVTGDTSEMVPDYLNCLHGVVDSADMPLNVSRQQVQESKILKMIKKSVVKKAIDMIEALVGTPKYNDFYKSFKCHLKLGVHEDSTNRERLASLLMYNTTVTGADNMAFLGDYVKRMKPEQTCIYYVTGENYAAVSKSSYLEQAQKLDIEVLLMVDPIDEYVIGQLKTFQGKELVSLCKEGVELPVSEEIKKEREEKIKKIKPFCDFVLSVLGDKVEKVVPSFRMVKSPFCVVTSQYGWSANMERIMKAQALRDSTQMGYMVGKKHLEVNPDHQIVEELNRRYEADPNAAIIRDVIQLLLSTSLMSSGFSLEDPGNYAAKIYRMVELGLNLEESTIIPETVSKTAVPEDEKDTDEEFMKSSDDDGDRMEEVD